MILGERGDELVSHAVRKIVLRRIARKIRQREHRDRLNRTELAPGEDTVTNSRQIKNHCRSGKQKDEGKRGYRSTPPIGSACTQSFGECRFRNDYFLRRVGLSAVVIAVFEFSYKAVAFPRNGLDEVGLIGVFPQRAADLANSSVDAVFGIDEYLFAPEPLADLLPGDNVAALLGEQDE